MPPPKQEQLPQEERPTVVQEEAVFMVDELETEERNNNRRQTSLPLSPRYGTMDANDGDEIHSNSKNRPPLPKTITDLLHIDDAIERLGMGRFQYQILLAAGLCFMADAMEVLLLSFLAVILRHEWDLMERQMDTIISVVFAGALTGTLILSPLGDTWGRRPVFAATAGLIAIAGIATAFCQRYPQLLAARFLVGFGVGGLTVPFDTLSEMLPNSCRGRNLLYIEFFWTLGTLSVPLLAYWSLGTGTHNESNWQLFVILCSIPCIVSTILGVILVPESPRWLLEHNPTDQRRERALKILREAATLNGHEDAFVLFPPGTRLTAETVHEKQHPDELRTSTVVATGDVNISKEVLIEPIGLNKYNSFWELFSPAWRRITFLLWGAWFGLGFLYYGVILEVSMVFTVDGEDVVQDDDANAVATYNYIFDYAAIFISASSEVFGLLAVLWTIDSWGRINSQTASYMAGGVACLLLGLGAHHGLTRPWMIALAFLSRMAMMAASCTTWVSTSEILPTEIRATGHGTANAMARLGGFLSPYFITEGNPMAFIGVLVFFVAMGTSACSYQLPETAGKAMGDVLDVTTSSTANIGTKVGDDAHDEARTPYQII